MKEFIKDVLVQMHKTTTTDKYYLAIEKTRLSSIVKKIKGFYDIPFTEQFLGLTKRLLLRMRKLEKRVGMH